VPEGPSPRLRALLDAPPWGGIVVLFIVFELLLSVADLAFGPWGQMHWEELFNVRAGFQAACGHVASLETLQYRTFCGGCTAEAVVAAPLFLALGPTVLVWKIMLLGFYGGILAGGALVLRRIGGPAGGPAGLAWVGLNMASPGWYRELIHTGWGNHLESAAFPLLALALLLRRPWAGPELPEAPRGALDGAWRGCAAGLLLGAGLWFCQTSAWGAPLVLLALLDAPGWRGRLGAALGLLPAAAAGAWPAWAYYRDRPGDTEATLDWWSAISVAPPGRLVDWLWGPYLRSHLWDPPDYGDQALGGAYWFGLWALALLGMGRLLLQRAFGADRPSWIGALVVPGCLAVLIGVYALRFDLWGNLPDLYVNGAFNLRYRTPLIPILGLGAALGAGWPFRSAALRWGSRTALVGLLALGLGLRLGQYHAPNLQLIGLRAYLHDGWADKVVPLGQPPQPLLRAQGRPVDIDAALAFATDHEDALADCRLDHRFELGRRIGLAAAEGQLAAVAGRLDAALRLPGGEGERALLVDGLAKALLDDQGRAAPGLAETLLALDAIGAAAGAPGFGAAVGEAAGARAHGAFHDEEDALHVASLPPSVWNGLCRGRGRWRVVAEAEAGRRPPGGLLPPEVTRTEAGRCLGGDPADAAAYASGVGEAWARYGGCGAAAEARLLAFLGPEAASEAAVGGLAAGCARLR